MTTSGSGDVVAALRRAAVRATLAPSVRNTQPWRFVLRGRTLEIHADWTRGLPVLDRRGQQLLMSCGAATFNARVSLAASGYDAEVERYPAAPAPSDLVVRLTVGDTRVQPLSIGALDAVVERRRTNRRPFIDEPVPDDLVDVLMDAAAAEGAELVAVRRPEHQRAIARLTEQANAVEQLDPGYRADLRASAGVGSWQRDGVVGPRDRSTGALDTGADARRASWSPPAAGGGEASCVLVLGCADDTPLYWLRTGEAMERVLLEITRHGYAASPFLQALEVATTSTLVREYLELGMYPQVMLRVGRAASTPAPRRRRLVDVFDEIVG